MLTQQLFTLVWVSYLEVDVLILMRLTPAAPASLGSGYAAPITPAARTSMVVATYNFMVDVEGVERLSFYD